MFDKSERTLIKMLLERGTVTKIAGVVKDGSHESRWEVRKHVPVLFGDETYYTGSLSGMYDPIEGDTLDEILDQLETWVAEDRECRARRRQRRLA